MKKFNLKNLSVILCACLSLALPAHAQQRTGGFGGGGFGGGFGGFGGGQ
jgi:hypothetical protein